MADIQECPVCGVKIEDNAKVLFSHGRPGTRGRLTARVCQFIKDKEKRDACINQEHPHAEIIVESDYYD